MIHIVTGGIIIVRFAGRPVAVVTAEGRILIRDPGTPIDLIDFLINRTDHKYKWN
jgi:hypothetical protein